MRWKRETVVENSHLVQRRYDFFGDDTVNITVVNSGLTQAGSGTSVTLASTASSTDNAYRGYGFTVVSGTGSGQDRSRITAYDGTTKVATLFPALTIALDTTSAYQVVNRGYP